MGAVVVLQRHPERNVGGGVVDAALLHLTDRGECLGCKTNQGRGVKSIESIKSTTLEKKSKVKTNKNNLSTTVKFTSKKNSRQKKIQVKKKIHVKNQFVVMNQIVVNLTGGGFAKRGVVIQCPAAFDVVQG